LVADLTLEFNLPSQPMVFTAPSRRGAFREVSRAAADFLRMKISRSDSRNLSHIGEARRVMVVPGFGAGDGYTRWLRDHLEQIGFQTEGWGLGKNTAGKGLTGAVDFFDVPNEMLNRPELEVCLLAMKLREHVKARAAETGEKYILIGHSLGGYLSREVARQLPESVDQLITMGSPVYGGPKYTAGAPLYTRRGVDLDWIEAQIAEREKLAIKVPITTIVSPTDAIVDYQASIDRGQPHARLIEIDVSHYGMAFNQQVWEQLFQTLALSAKT
jgi:pimeloyl-ACP methyl ester carboxylesterase